METNHEKNLNQGKRPEQYEKSATIMAIAVVVIIILCLFLLFGDALNLR